MNYDLTKMTKQEVFDAVCNHLLTQGGSSVRTFHAAMYCAYRGDDGKKCAAGIFIPDDKYDVDMEQHKWVDIIEKYGLPSDHQYLISNMQNIHDSATVLSWKYALHEYAITHRLKFNYDEGK